MGKWGLGRGTEAHGNTESDTGIPSTTAAPLGTQSGRQLQLGPEANTSWEITYPESKWSD